MINAVEQTGVLWVRWRSERGKARCSFLLAWIEVIGSGDILTVRARQAAQTAELESRATAGAAIDGVPKQAGC